MSSTSGLALSAAYHREVVAPLLERAFTKGKPKAVALAINSPGGSPVQSSLIAARIRRLAEKHEVPVHAFVEDVAAYCLRGLTPDIGPADAAPASSTPPPVGAPTTDSRNARNALNQAPNDSVGVVRRT